MNSISIVSLRTITTIALALTIIAALAPAKAGEIVAPATTTITQEIPWGITGSAGGTSDDAYGGVELLFPLWFDGDTLLFLYPEVEIADKGRQGYALGLGLRQYFEEWNAIAGISAFWDITDSTYDNTYNGFGLSGEILTKWVDARLNWYANTDKENLIDRQEQSSSFSSTNSSTSYSAPYARVDQILQSTTTTTTTKTTNVSQTFERFESAMDGLDVEAGVLIPYIDEILGMELRVFGGYYTYDNPYGDDIKGFKARGELRVTDWLTADIAYYDDKELFGGNVYGGARVHFPLGKLERQVSVSGGYVTPAATTSYGKSGIGKSPVTFDKGYVAAAPDAPDNIAHRLTENIIRTPRILTADSGYIENKKKREESTKTTRKSSSHTSVILDDVVFVNNGPATGNGIAAGEDGPKKKVATKAGDYVRAGDPGTAENPVYYIQDGVDIAYDRYGSMEIPGWEGTVFVQGTPYQYQETVEIYAPVTVTSSVTAQGGYTFGSTPNILTQSFGNAPVLDGGFYLNGDAGANNVTINGFAIINGIDNGSHADGDGIHVVNVPNFTVTNTTIGYDPIFDEPAEVPGNGIGVFNDGVSGPTFATISGVGVGGPGQNGFYASTGGEFYGDFTDSFFAGSENANGVFIDASMVGATFDYVLASDNEQRGFDITARDGDLTADFYGVDATYNGSDGAYLNALNGNTRSYVDDSYFADNGFNSGGNGFTSIANNGTASFDSYGSSFMYNAQNGFVVLGNYGVHGNNSPALLENVDASYNGFNGGVIVSENGAVEVAVLNSSFDDNGQAGIVSPTGEVPELDAPPITEIPGGNGLGVAAGYGVASFDAANSTFDGNFENGLVVTGMFGVAGNNSPATLNNISASGNGDNGALIITGLSLPGMMMDTETSESDFYGGDIELAIRNSNFNSNGFGENNLPDADVDINYDDGLLVATPIGGNIYFDAANSTFDSNRGNGLEVDAYDGIYGNNSPVTLTNVNASNNGQEGASFYANFGDIELAVVGSAFNNNGQGGIEGDGLFAEAGSGRVYFDAHSTEFWGNNDDGLDVEAFYDITASLGNVTANDNGEDGVDFFSSDGGVYLNIYNSEFNNNDEDGIEADAQYDIDAVFNNVRANDNNSEGAQIASTDGNVDLIVRNSRFNRNDSQNFEVDADNGFAYLAIYNSQFNDSRDDDGLEVDADSGVDAVLYNVQANGNDDSGAEFDSGSGNVDLMVSNSQFNGNDDENFEVDADGNITVALNNIQANDSNDDQGVEIDSTNGNIRLEVSNSSFNFNNAVGLDVDAENGRIYFDAVNSSFFGNGEDGMVFDGYDGIMGNNGGPATLANLIVSSNGETGGDFYSEYGDIALLVLSSSFNNNGSDGLRVAADDGDVYFDAYNSSFSGNNEDGLDVYAYDDIMGNSGPAYLSNVRANNNGGDGAAFYSDSDDISLEVSRSQFNDNGVNGMRGNGLIIDSDGGDVYFDAHSTDFSGNYDDGLYIYADNMIGGNYGDKATVTASSANDNGIDGIHFDTDGGNIYASFANVTTNRNGYDADDSGDFGSGLMFDATTSGDLDLMFNNVVSNSNYDEGINVREGRDLRASLSRVSTNFNGDDGIDIDNERDITFLNMSRVNASYNDSDGIDIENSGDTFNASITTSTVNGNGGNGIEIGTEVDSFSGFIGGISANDNGEDGINIGPDGNFNGNITNVAASNNVSDGIDIDANGNFNGSITDVAFFGNDDDGLDVDVNGNFNGNITDLTSNYNDSDGIEIFTTGNFNGNINRVDVIDNNDDGLDVDTSGNFNGHITNVDALSNSDDGAHISLGGNLNGDFSRNNTSYNGDDGAEFDDIAGNWNGNATNNVSNLNGESGIDIDVLGDMTGAVAGNVTNGNVAGLDEDDEAGLSLTVDGTFTGPFSFNQSNFNTNVGIRTKIGTVDGTSTSDGNQAFGNGTNFDLDPPGFGD